MTFDEAVLYCHTIAAPKDLRVISQPTSPVQSLRKIILIVAVTANGKIISPKTKGLIKAKADLKQAAVAVVFTEDETQFKKNVKGAITLLYKEIEDAANDANGDDAAPKKLVRKEKDKAV